MTGVESIDAVFREARSIDNKVITAQAGRKSARENVNGAMGLDAATPFTDALSTLRTRAPEGLSVALSEGRPVLTSAGAMSGDLQGAVTAVNGAATTYHQILLGLASLPEDCVQLVAKLGQLNPASLRGQMTTSSPDEIMEKLQVLDRNINSIKKLPQKVKTLITNLKDDLAAISANFSAQK